MDACKHGGMHARIHSDAYTDIYMHVSMAIQGWRVSRDAWMGRIHASEGSCAVPVSARQQERWWGCCACVCAGTSTWLSHPTPPTRPWVRKWVTCFALGAQRKWVKFRVRKWVRDRVPKLQPKGLILWRSMWSTFWCSKWSHGALSDLAL